MFEVWFKLDVELKVCEIKLIMIDVKRDSVVTRFLFVCSVITLNEYSDTATASATILFTVISSGRIWRLNEIPPPVCSQKQTVKWRVRPVGYFSSRKRVGIPSPPCRKRRTGLLIFSPNLNNQLRNICNLK